MDDRGEERRRGGPLGEGNSEEETRQVPVSGEEERTQRVPLHETDPSTRVIRTPGGAVGDTAVGAQGYPRGYLEAAAEREARLRDMYGGIDWLASFVGWVVAAVAGAFLSLVASFILIPLGFSFNLGPGGLTPAAITGLVTVGVVLFLAYFVGGYVAGRMARFDGGRNGMLVVLWGIVISILMVVLASFLPGGVFQAIQGFVAGNLVPAIGSLGKLGLIGAGIVVGVLVIELLAGFLGGRMGSGYHSNIDHTT